jgi:hypothetical protein
LPSGIGGRRRGLSVIGGQRRRLGGLRGSLYDWLRRGGLGGFPGGLPDFKNRQLPDRRRRGRAAGRLPATFSLVKGMQRGGRSSRAGRLTGARGDPNFGSETVVEGVEVQPYVPLRDISGMVEVASDQQ